MWEDYGVRNGDTMDEVEFTFLGNVEGGFKWITSSLGWLETAINELNG
jgi:hypothetical protein